MAMDNRNTRLTQNTTIKVRLLPTPAQAELFDKTFGCCRYIWNRILADHEEFYAATGAHFLPTPAKYKKEAPFLKEVDSLALATVHQNLRGAFQRFFDQPEQFGYPVFKKKKNGKNSYTTFRSTQANSLYLTRDGIRMPKLGIVRAVFHRRPLHWWTLKSATISKTPTGKYFCALTFEYTTKEPEPVLPTVETTVGLQYSVSHFYTDSDGCTPAPPHWLGRSKRKLANMQRRLSRMERGSKNYQQQLQKIRLLHEHIANQRKDFLHKESRRIANDWDAVCVRDSELISMKGFGQFRICLQYKLKRQGKHYISVDRFFPCSRTCHNCGYVHEPFQRVGKKWHCPGCGATLVHDTNAARNLKQQGLAKLVDTQEVKRSA